jgi:hypothetical protein
MFSSSSRAISGAPASEVVTKCAACRARGSSSTFAGAATASRLISTILDSDLVHWQWHVLMNQVGTGTEFRERLANK